MATLATLTLDVLDMLYGQTPTQRPDQDTLAIAVASATDTSWLFANAGNQFWSAGDYAEYFDGTGTAGEVVRLRTSHDSAAYVTVDRAQRRTTAAAATVIGTATYDETGGAAEDLWTVSAAHGLSVGDNVVFSVAGTGATGYAASTGYYVVSVPAVTTLTLASTAGDSAIAGSGDGTGWTLVTPAYSDGDLFVRNPPFICTEIARAINETIDSDLQTGIWYRTNRTITYQTDRYRYPLNASDYKVDRMYQVDVDATTLGSATFDVTGGAAEDLWTLASHGLAVGDPVRFSAVGTGASPYEAGVTYWVATVPTANTFTLSATESTIILEGTTTDSVGTWTLQDIIAFNFTEYDGNAYDVVTNVATTVESTGRAVLLRRIVDSGATIHYVARSRPSSSAIASLPTEIANLVPWGAVARLAGGTAIRQRYAPASTQITTPYIDASFFKAQFNEMVDRYRTKLLGELAPQRHWQFGPIRG